MDPKLTPLNQTVVPSHWYTTVVNPNTVSTSNNVQHRIITPEGYDPKTVEHPPPQVAGPSNAEMNNNVAPPVVSYDNIPGTSRAQQGPRSAADIVMDVLGDDLDRPWLDAELRFQSHESLIDKILNRSLTPMRKPKKLVLSPLEDDEGETVGRSPFTENVYPPEVNRIFVNALHFHDVDAVMKAMEDLFNFALFPVAFYTDGSVTKLKFDFPFLYVNCIQKVFRQCRYRYAPTYMVLSKVQDRLMERDNLPAMCANGTTFRADQIRIDRFDKTFQNVRIQLLTSKRFVPRRRAFNQNPELVRQVELVELFPACERAYDDMINQQEEFRQNEMLHDCPVCYDSFRIANFVQCQDGHLACRTCLVSMVEQIVSGQGAAQVKCLANQDSCEYPYSEGTLMTRLPRKLYRRYTMRVGQEQVAIANLQGLEQCPGCGIQVEMPVASETDRVLSCANVNCKRQTCRLCREPWDALHIGKRCNELEKDVETKKRKQ